MDTMRICPGCQKPLSANAPDGLCPKCLIKAGLGTGIDIGPDSQSQAEGGQVHFVAPTPEELVKPFPQLEILGFIGQGGMGAVYRARQKALDRIVALKILPPDIGKDPAFAERFTREAKALAKLNHPGIVTLYEFGQADGLFFFLMELVDGVNLRHLLQAGRLSPREALAIVPQICDALQYAHDQGIVHRDIKPENILLDRQGRVKVADFGLAKLVGTEGEPSAAGVGVAGSAVLTEAGKVMGTPQYMAPEQQQYPTEVDHRADIYSLGVVFYQMLTGELPGKPIEPPSHKVQVDVRLDEVVLRALEKDPQRRYQQVSRVKTDVQAITGAASALGAEVRPASPPSALGWRDRWLWDSRNWIARGYLIFLALALLLMPVWILIWGPLAFCALALVPPAAVYAWVGQGIKKLKANLPPSDAEVAEAWIAWEEGLWPFNRSQGLAVLHADRLELVPLWYGTPITVVLNDIISVREVDQVYVRLVWKRGFVLVLENGDRVSIAIPEPFARRWRARLSGGTALEKEAERRYQQVSEAKAMVESISSSSSPVTGTAPSPARPAATRGRLRAALIVGVLVWLFVAGIVTLITWIRPESWKVVAVISCPHSQSGRPVEEHFKFIATMMELMQSDVILGRVIDRLQLDERSGKLDERWGKHKVWLKLTKAQAMVLLKRRLDVRSEGGTLIQLGVFGKRPEELEEAMDIANTIVEELRAFRIEQHESPADMLEMTLRFTPPNILLGLAAGFVLGLLAGGFVLWRGKPSKDSGSGEARTAAAPVDSAANKPAVRKRPLTLVGVRNGQRAIHWPGLILLAALLVAAAGGLSLFFYKLLVVKASLGLVTGLLAGFILLGLKLKRAWTTPVERLPQLDTAGAPTRPQEPPIFFSRLAKFSLAITVLGVLLVLGGVANFHFVLGVEKTAMLICGAIVFAAGCVGLALAMHGAAPLVSPEPPGLGGDATRRRPVWDRIAVVLLITAALVTGYLLMSYSARMKLQTMQQATRGAEEATLAEAESPNRVLEVRCEDRKATIRAELDDRHKLRLFIGNDLYGWSAQGTGSKSVTATVEASSQIKMEDGSVGRGLIFQARGGRQYIAITPGGPVPYGEVVFRPNSEITDENGTFTFADIHQTDGVRIPISICVRPVASKPPDMGGFGPVIDTLMATADADDQGWGFFDLETDKSFDPPFSLTFQPNQGPAFVELTPELKEWIKARGVDLLLHLGENTWDLMTLGMQEEFAGQLNEWETTSPEKIVGLFAKKNVDHPVRDEVPASSFGHSYRGEYGSVTAFRTRSNTMGVYQLQGMRNSTRRSVGIRFKLVREAGETAQSTGGDPRSRTFILHHMLASEMADDLRQILLGRFGMEARPAPDNMQLTVTAPPEVLNRVTTFVAVNDWPKTIPRSRENAEGAARSFFYACSIEDIEGVMRMLAPGVLAELKGTKLTAHGVWEEENDAELVRQLRGDWPGKDVAVRRVIQAWNRFPLRRIRVRGEFSISFGPRYYASAEFEGAPEQWVELSFIPDRTGGTDGPLMIDTLPPWFEQMESGLEASKPSPDKPPAAGCEASKIVWPEDIPTERET